MRYVPRINFVGNEWVDWLADCQKALDHVNVAPDRSKAIKAKEGVYKAAVPFLEKLFGKKCAYCEAPFDSGRLEVEHFRPKLRASDQKNASITVIQGSKKVEHPGYYWLAFSWANLLPGCTACNQLPAKANKFPLALEGTRAWTPGDPIEKEELLLLDPCNDNPEDHLNYDTAGNAQGKVVPKTEKGRVSIDVFKLNRDGLVVARMGLLFAIGKAKNVVTNAENLGPDEFKNAVEDIRARCEADQPYSALWVAKTHQFLWYAEQRLKAMTAGDQEKKAG